MSISSAILLAQNKVAAAYTSCNNMGATMPALSDQNLSHLPATIESIPQGSSTTEASPNDVNFYDYDGTIVYSYSAADFLALSAMPDNPSHDGLTAQGWNWSLADAQTYVTSNGVLDVGQMYVTDDGDTRLFIKVMDPARATVDLRFYQSVSGGVTIDWGDGSATETISGTGNVNQTHTYSTYGDYTILLTVTSGTMRLGGGGNYNVIAPASANGDFVYSDMLRGVFVGSSVDMLQQYAFKSCQKIKFVSLPSTVTSLATFAFQACYLPHLTVPSGVTNLSNYGFFSAAGLRTVSLPNTITSGGYCFYGTYMLARLVLPTSYTAIGANFFLNNYSVASMVVPSTVTSIGNYNFNNCPGVKEYHFLATTPPTLGSYCFTNIASDCVIYVPSGTLAAYQSATNWSSFSSYMQEE